MPRHGLIHLPVLRRTEDLQDFLRELDWPLPFDAWVEDLTFDWAGEDLRLPDTAGQRFAGGSVRQLRPLVEGQPWGIFLVELAQPPVCGAALRNLLRRLVPSRRRDPSSTEWQHANLLFICATANYGQVTFAHYRAEKAGRARLATFGWEQGSRSARTLWEFNVPALAWPPRPADAAGWLHQWGRAFDVAPVTNEFFRVYADVLQRVEAVVAGLAAHPEKRRLWTQRLFHRLMFIAFIEKKGWLRLGERTDYLAALWEAWQREPDRTGLSFYAARLQPLFFLALNHAEERNFIGTHRGGRFAHPLGDGPYLNGGLFEQDADDKDTAIDVPDEAVGTILNDLFARFNFTATESTPLDVEVAVDPEMLGKVFEELVTGRHESGSYYTPKPIVAFMCREALKHYLAGASAEEPAALARFVDAHDPAGLRDGERVLGALKRVRVCDPACGSGAYLLGMLHELAALRECLFATQKIDSPSSYARKLEIIQHNLYGVDLDPCAANIARLRLWLSLAVADPGETPPPRPNLDFKIGVGDSLGAPDPQIASSGQGALRVRVAQQLRAAEAAYLLAHGAEKKAWRGKVNALRGELQIWLHGEASAGAFDWAVEFTEIFAPRPAPGGQNPGDALAATEAGGFDIIVANPPYVRQELIKAQKPLLKARYECYDGTADLFVYFYERAARLLRRGGTLALISPNKFYRAGYGKRLRAFLARETSVRTLVDFGDTAVFGVMAYASILIAVRTRPAPDASAQVLTWTEGGGAFERIGELVAARSQPLALSELGRGGWRLESPAGLRLLTKLRASGTPLGEYVQGRFYYGIKTGLNAAFVVDRATRDRLMAEDASSAEVLKPYLRGRDVKRWGCQSRDLWLIFTRKGCDINRYPAIRAHLKEFRTALTPGVAGGRRSGPYAWYEIQDRVAYWTEFTRPKIITGRFMNAPTFAYDEGGFFHNNANSFIAGGTRFLTAVLNSQAAWWALTKSCTDLQGGYLQAQNADLAQIPIPAATSAEQAALGALVERILAARGTGDAAAVRALEAEIDTQVFRLYRLTRAEQALIASGR